MHKDNCGSFVTAANSAAGAVVSIATGLLFESTHVENTSGLLAGKRPAGSLMNIVCVLAGVISLVARRRAL
jgi:hypothetical protein